MEARNRILTEARRLTIEHGAVPSLNAVVAAAGVSKGGLIHHFPTRDALIEALGRQALADVDAAMVDAAEDGQAARVWLRLSVPHAEERDVYRALLIAYQAIHVQLNSLVQDAAAMTVRWEAMIATELGDANKARVVRLVGDGLIANSLIAPDTVMDDTQIDRLLATITDR